MKNFYLLIVSIITFVLGVPLLIVYIIDIFYESNLPKEIYLIYGFAYIVTMLIVFLFVPFFNYLEDKL